jgi:hypothetical protein
MTVEFEGKIEESDNDLVIRVPASEKARLIAYKGQTRKITVAL